ncbi:peptidoglycan-binding domain-containing protein [Actinokineospora sp. 24-640]
MTIAVPPLRGADPGMPVERRRPSRSWAGVDWSLSRRSILRAGTVVGLTALGAFPAVRRAVADGYDIYPTCPSYAADHNCSPGCGPSMVFGDACETVGANLGFHKNDGVTWTLRPNACLSGSYDGWMWRYDRACGSCACHIERRCHDGYRKVGSSWVRSICRWTTDCGCQQSVAWPTTASGSPSATVLTVQHLLTFRGYPTTVDGIYGSATTTAVRQFQSAGQLATTGKVDPPTWPKLVVTTRSGESGHQVRAAQSQLNRYGYRLTVDGVFGSGTAAAARDFQGQNGLTVDGVLGPNTWRTLTGGAS